MNEEQEKKDEFFIPEKEFFINVVNNIPKGYTLNQDKKANFLHGLLKDDFKCYINIYKEYVFEFFNIRIQASLFKGSDNKGKVYYFSRKMDCKNMDQSEISNYKNIENARISQHLRNSFTLTINDENCYDNPDIKVVFGESGFLFLNNFVNIDADSKNEQNEKFENTLILYALYIAYMEKIDEFLQNTSTLYFDKKHKNASDIRKQIYIFGLKHFFSNPVKHSRQQLHVLWNIIEEYYKIGDKYAEVKAQAEDIIDIIEIEQKEYDDNKQRKRDNRINLIAFIITLAGAISIVKDTIDLFKGG
ncbi:hypothetical protein FMM54_08445 [Campylobacter sp. LR185c]|uniref:hypothetical protein n=1 Tax=Campylobacter sp. LR185c TaxID=2014525 RepID=UPI0012380E6D|nr:hypothetical protein [Campylobacter sp. LR185c]KAA6220588.1 hypothetical protein FMM54_08445 [Campylobacter sp. LR185c]KAA8604252.1 hypothetical protein CGP82_03425 [Campylobacter sp. LR185c]